MKASNEQTSQGLSQRLHDAGFRGEHQRVWVLSRDKEPFIVMSRHSSYEDTIPAWTFSELWGVLPNRYWVDKNMYYWTIRTDQHQRCCIEVRHSHGVLKQIFKSKSPTEAVGLLLEWLIDNGHYLIGKGE